MILSQQLTPDAMSGVSHASVPFLSAHQQKMILARIWQIISLCTPAVLLNIILLTKLLVYKDYIRKHLSISVHKTCGCWYLTRQKIPWVSKWWSQGDPLDAGFYNKGPIRLLHCAVSLLSSHLRLLWDFYTPFTCWSHFNNSLLHSPTESCLLYELQGMLQKYCLLFNYVCPQHQNQIFGYMAVEVEPVTCSVMELRNSVIVLIVSCSFYGNK